VYAEKEEWVRLSVFVEVSCYTSPHGERAKDVVLPAVVERLCFLSNYFNKKLTVSCPLFLGILCSCWTYDAAA
jgi:hypothetical protein